MRTIFFSVLIFSFFACTNNPVETSTVSTIDSTANSTQQVVQSEDYPNSPSDDCLFVTNFSSGEIGVNYCQSAAYFLNGTIGNNSIELYINEKSRSKDSIFLSGNYWYTNHYKPLELKGFYSTNTKKLWLSSQSEKEVFHLENLEKQSFKGSWTMGEKTLDCTLQNNAINFNFIEAVQQQLEVDSSIFEINSKQQLRLNLENPTENLGNGFNDFSLILFNKWNFSWSVSRSEFSEISTDYDYFQRLYSGDKPVFLTANLYYYDERDEEKEEDENDYFSAYVFGGQRLQYLSLYTYDNNSWKKESLDKLKDEINLVLNSPKEKMTLTPSFLQVGKNRWIWDGQKFTKK